MSKVHAIWAQPGPHNAETTTQYLLHLPQPPRLSNSFARLVQRGCCLHMLRA